MTRTELIEELRETAERITRYTNSPYDGLMLAAADMLEADAEALDAEDARREVHNRYCDTLVAERDKLRAAIRLALENHRGNYELNDAECDKHSAAVELLCQAKNLSHK